jgi:hypothetical protein
MCSRHDAVQLEPPEGGSAAEPRLGGFCQLVRVVRPFHANPVMFSPHYNKINMWTGTNVQVAR